jgi:hypothetical protein
MEKVTDAGVDEVNTSSAAGLRLYGLSLVAGGESGRFIVAK